MVGGSQFGKNESQRSCDARNALREREGGGGGGGGRRVEGGKEEWRAEEGEWREGKK